MRCGARCCTCAGIADIVKHDTRRTALFEPNPRLGDLLAELGPLLARAEAASLPAPAATPRLPVVFVVGPPRSGTTLAMQWLAATGVFAWPSNLLSRFYEAPYVGALIQQVVTNPSLDFAGELTGAGIPARSFASRA